MKAISDDNEKQIIPEKFVLKVFRSIRWADGVSCPKCKSLKIQSRGKQGESNRYSCMKCENNFSDLTNTPFEYSKIPLGKILYILIHFYSKSINQLAEELDLHRNTVARYHKRIDEILRETYEDPIFNDKTRKWLKK